MIRNNDHTCMKLHLASTLVTLRKMNPNQVVCLLGGEPVENRASMSIQHATVHLHISTTMRDWIAKLGEAPQRDALTGVPKLCVDGNPPDETVGIRILYIKS